MEALAETSSNKLDAIVENLKKDGARQEKLELLEGWISAARDNGKVPNPILVEGKFPQSWGEILSALFVIGQIAESNSPPNANCETPNPRKRHAVDGAHHADGGARKDLLKPYINPPTGARSAVDLIEERIAKLIEDSKDFNRMAPFIFLFQSQGYGKTRAVLELAKSKRRVVYLPCKDLPALRSSGGPNEDWKVPKALEEMLSSLEQKGDENLCEHYWIRFLQSVQSEASNYDNAEALYEAQVTSEGKLGEFYTKLYWPKKNNCPTPQQKSAIRLPPPEDSQAQQQEEISALPAKKQVSISDICYKHATPIVEESLVVCLDEATALPDVAFRAFRRAAKHLGIIALFTDTTASISTVMPANDASSTPGGGQLGEFTEPIYHLPNFDLDFKYDAATDDLANLFRAGRPRWSSILTAIEEKKEGQGNECILQTLVDTVLQLLTRDEKIQLADRQNINSDNRKFVGNLTSILPNMVAVFTCRFGLGSRSKIASLLAKYSLATVADVSEDRVVVSTHYPSEPVLAAASAKFTIREANWRNVLHHVHAAVLENLLDAPRGDLGEMCAAALLGLTMDRIRYDEDQGNLGGGSVELKSLLSVFGYKGAEVDGIDALEGWKVNFTHFVRPPYNVDEYDLQIMWKRRTAYYVLEGMKGLDLLISIYNQDRGHATLKVQVKNYSAKFTLSERQDVMTKLSPRYCPPTITGEKFSVGLLLCVNEVDPHCALVDYNNSNRTIWPAPTTDRKTRSKSSKPEKFFLELAASFPKENDATKSSVFKEVLKISEKLREICKKSQTKETWDVSRLSMESWKRHLAKIAAEKPDVSSDAADDSVATAVESMDES